MFRETARAALAFVYPNRCPFCNGIIGAREYYCPECAASLRYFESGTAQPPQGLSELFACCVYSGAAREAVHRLKDGSYGYSAEAFGVLMTEVVGENIRGYDALAPVPSSFGSILRRGYAPAEYIAREMSRRSGVRVLTALSATRVKSEQKRLSASQRRENASGAFELSDENIIRGKKILLIDDICTTGATLSACAELLRKAGAAQVGGAVFAKTVGSA
ncbi:MAG: ComF family protein [Oscillospiraceae bacterium]